jgi:uncharacterized protein YjbJ (UPF0337 family)
MDRDRIEGNHKSLSGRGKEFFGRVFGDTKLRIEGTMDLAEGKVPNTIGSIKDGLRDDGRRGP